MIIKNVPVAITVFPMIPSEVLILIIFAFLQSLSQRTINSKFQVSGVVWRSLDSTLCFSALKAEARNRGERLLRKGQSNVKCKVKRSSEPSLRSGIGSFRPHTAVNLNAFCLNNRH